jgi:hypothetical protein
MPAGATRRPRSDPEQLPGEPGETTEVDAAADLHDLDTLEQAPVASQGGVVGHGVRGPVEVEGAQVLPEEREVVHGILRIASPHAQPFPARPPPEEHERLQAARELDGAGSVDGIEVHVGLSLERPELVARAAGEVRPVGRLAVAHGIDLSASTHVGDSDKDRDAARAAGIPVFVTAREFFGW